MAPQGVAQQGERGLVGPLQVVQHDQRGTIGREASKDRRHRLEEHEPLAGGLAPHRDAVPQFRQDEREIGGDVAGEGRDLAAGEPVERPAERFGERLVRPQRFLVAPPVEHERAGVGGVLGQGTGEAGLADAGFPAHESERGPPTRGRRPGSAQCRQFALAAHQFRVAVQPQRRGNRRGGAPA